MPTLTEGEKRQLIKKLVDLFQDNQQGQSYLVGKLTGEVTSIGRLGDDPIAVLYPHGTAPASIQNISIDKETKESVAALFDFVAFGDEVKAEGIVIKQIRTHIERAVAAGAISEEKEGQERINLFFQEIRAAFRKELEENAELANEFVIKVIPGILGNYSRSLESADRLNKLVSDCEPLAKYQTHDKEKIRLLEPLKTMLAQLSHQKTNLDLYYERLRDGVVQIGLIAGNNSKILPIIKTILTQNPSLYDRNRLFTPPASRAGSPVPSSRPQSPVPSSRPQSPVPRSGSPLPQASTDSGASYSSDEVSPRSPKSPRSGNQ